jgi:putative aldouronate transport system permease protein
MSIYSPYSRKCKEKQASKNIAYRYFCSAIYNGVDKSSRGKHIVSITSKRILPRCLKKNWDLYLMLLPVALFFIIFHYWPMYGVQIAFKDFIASEGIWGSPWVGFEHFQRFFKTYNFGRLFKNTIGISLYSLMVGFPAPIFLALMINEVRNTIFKKIVQTVTYIPHFLSLIVLTGMMLSFLSPQNGFINMLIQALGGETVNFILKPGWFKTLYVFSGIWQNAGWSSIIYVAALAGIDTELYHAAMVDGASKFQRLQHITVPGILPTAVIMLILECGRLMNVGFEKIYLMQNNLNMPASDVFATYIYRIGILGTQFSFTTAIGLFNSIINFVLVLTVNKISKKITETSLW